MHFKIFIVCDKRSFGITGEGDPKGDTLVSVQFYEQLNTLLQLIRLAWCKKKFKQLYYIQIQHSKQL